MNPLLVVCVTMATLTWSSVRASNASNTVPDRVPVMIGGERNLDACGATALVTGLQPVDGNLLAVRSGPGLHYSRINSLAPGARVWLCDHKGRWLGVVYSPSGEDCSVASPSAARRRYSGPCISGWVRDRYLTLEAG